MTRNVLRPSRAFTGLIDAPESTFHSSSRTGPHAAPPYFSNRCNHLTDSAPPHPSRAPYNEDAGAQPCAPENRSRDFPETTRGQSPQCPQKHRPQNPSRQACRPPQCLEAWLARTGTRPLPRRANRIRPPPGGLPRRPPAERPCRDPPRPPDRRGRLAHLSPPRLRNADL